VDRLIACDADGTHAPAVSRRSLVTSVIMIASSLTASSLSSVSASFTAKTSSVKRTERVRRASVVARAREVKSSAQGEVSKTRGVREMFASTAVLGGVVASAALQATFPEQAQALSIRDPVFGDIEVWQFLVITAGYFIGIEIYLDRKYDDKNKPIMPTVQKKEDAADEAKEE